MKRLLLITLLLIGLNNNTYSFGKIKEKLDIPQVNVKEKENKKIFFILNRVIERQSSANELSKEINEFIQDGWEVYDFQYSKGRMCVIFYK